MGPASALESDATALEFYNLVLDENLPLVAVLAGHIHMYHKDMLNENIIQLVSDTSSNGSGTLFKITGN